MRKVLLGALALALVAGLVPAQPNDGDLIVGQFRDPNTPGSYGPGSILGVDPSTGKVYTIAPKFTTLGTIIMGPNWIEMGSDNKNFMVAGIPTGATPTALGNGIYFMSVNASTGAVIKTLVADTTASVGYCNCFDMDGDGTWILGGGTRLFSFDENTMTYQTLFNKTSPAGTVNGLTLDPALPKGDIAIVNFTTSASTTANLIEADRNGVISTISTYAPYYGAAVDVDYSTGDYICAGFGSSTLNAAGEEYMRVAKNGAVTTLNYPANSVRLFRANGLYIDQQHMSWVLTYDLTGVTVPVPTSLQPSLVCSLFKMDGKGTFVTMYNYSTTLTRNNFAAAGVTEYGSRHTVCNGSGKPGTSVAVKFSSRKVGDAGKAYQLAASFGYTNGIKFANGEFLDLSFDVLMFATANNLFPTIFKKFTGFLNRSGEAMASVDVPAGLPTGLGIPIYISGVVIDPRIPGGISTIGNTHWFTLN